MRDYRRALTYFDNDGSRVAAILALINLSNILGVIWPMATALVIDVVLLDKHANYWAYRWFERFAPASKVSQIVILAAGMLVIRLGSELTRMIYTLISIRVGYNGLMRVRCELFQKLQALSLAYHKSQPQGDAIYRLSSDSLGFQSVLNVMIGVVVNLAMLVYITAFMLSMSWKLTIVSLAIVPLLLWTIRHYGRIFKLRYSQSYEVDSQITTAIQRSVASIGLVQAFGRERDEFENFAATQGNNVAVKMRLHWDEVMYWLVLGTIFAVSSAAILGVGAYISLTHRDTFTPGMLGAFLILLGQLYDPLNKLSSSGSSLTGGITQVRRVFEVLDRDPTIKDSPGALDLPMQPRTLTFDRACFAYKPGVPVLSEIDVQIVPGQMVAFVGSSGVGKTTLLNLLPRFYDPTGGSMRLDGRDARQIKVAALRRHVALVLQDSVILPTTVAENISYGRPDASPADIRRAADLAGATTFIEQMPHGFATEVSEAGSNLSGGQKQRISIARALLTEAPIIVMDEPTSALDPHHERLITDTLAQLKRQRTIILVSHRLSTVMDCDQIFMMEGGRIVERGTHDQLISLRGHYFAMARHQLRIEDPVEAGPL